MPAADARFLAGMVAALSSIGRPAGFVPHALRLLDEAFGFDSCVIALEALDQARGLVVMGASGLCRVAGGTTAPRSDHPWAQVMTSGAPVVLSHSAVLPGRRSSAAGTGAAAYVPFSVDRRQIGVLGAYRPTAEGSFSTADVHRLTRAGRYLAAPLEVATRYRGFARLSMRDRLTGLAGRREVEAALEAEAARCVRYSVPLSVVMVDVDRFTRINTQFGQRAGNNVLRMIAAALLMLCRGVDVVARWGSDEYVVVLPHTERAAARQIAERLRAHLASMALIDKVRLTASFGVASLPDDGVTTHALVQAAAEAAFAAKRSGGNRVSHL